MSNVTWRRGSVSAAIAAGIALIFSTSSLFMSPFALFLTPVSTDLRWTPAIYPQSLLIVSILYAILAPIAGRASDRMGAAPIVIGGVVCLALGFFGLSRMSGSLIQLFLCSAALGVAAPLVSPATLAPVVARWFDKGRGLMMGLILGAGPQVAAAVFSPLISRMIGQFGWRATYQSLAVIALVVSIPITMLFLKGPPAAVAATSVANSATPPPGLTLKEALRGRPFWLMLAASALLALVYGGVSGHLVAWQTDHGLSAAFSASALSAMFMGAVVGPIVAGFCADRIHRPQVLAPFVAAPLLALGLMILQGGEWMTLLGASLLGFGFSAWVGQIALLVTRYYGLRSTGELSGILISCGGIALGLGPVLIGIVRTVAGSYEPAMIACLIVLSLAPLCVLILPDYPAASPPETSRQAG